MSTNLAQKEVIQHQKTRTLDDTSYLPLKKRICAAYYEKNSSIREETGNEEKGDDEEIIEIETNPRKWIKIQPGVIRHTSCPNTNLAFYLKYD